MALQCPKCLSAMTTLDFNGVEVERCGDCYGLFFDDMEKETLKSLQGAESIDIGDEFVGARLNEILDVPCPKCRVKMNHIVQEEPFEIKFESCPDCHGTFFDAGEFRDYLADEIFESFQSLIESIR